MRLPVHGGPRVVHVLARPLGERGGLVKAPLTYFGAKALLAPRMVELFPPHEHYVEPFCGSLAVLLAKEPSAHETVNDLDQDLMTFWRTLRDREDDLVRACMLTPHSRAEHAATYEPMDALDDLERARRVWVQLTMPKPEEHTELASALNDCKSAVVLSGYASPLYDDLYAGWHRREIQTATGQGGTWSERTEVVWSNRPFPEPAADLLDIFSDDTRAS